jgi:hypothetical protein
MNFCRGKMADKKKDKASVSKPKLSPNAKPFEIVTPSQLSSRDLVLRNSPVQMVNRFTTTLGSTISPKLTFQSALVSQSHYDPFEKIKPQRTTKSFPKTSPYFAKLPSHNLFFIESDFSHLKSPKAFAKACTNQPYSLPKGFRKSSLPFSFHYEVYFPKRIGNASLCL